jgi:hypothetical protein
VPQHFGHAVPDAGREQAAPPGAAHFRRRPRLLVALEDERVGIEPSWESAEALEHAPGGAGHPRAPLGRVVDDRVQDRHVALSARFRRPQALTRPRAPDLDEARLQVEILPLEPADLARATA